MPNDLINWKSLIKATIAGESAATSTLLGHAQKPLFNYCYHLTHNRQLAEDLTHDALLKGLTSLAQLKEPDAFLAWLKSIARFLYLDFVKSAANSKAHIQIEDAMNESHLVENPSISPEQIHASRVLKQLSEEDRSILILIDIQECSYREASEVLKIPEGTVKSRLSRARDKFADLFNGTNQAARSSPFQGVVGRSKAE